MKSEELIIGRKYIHPRVTNPSSYMALDFSKQINYFKFHILDPLWRGELFYYFALKEIAKMQESNINYLNI